MTCVYIYIYIYIYIYENVYLYSPAGREGEAAGHGGHVRASPAKLQHQSGVQGFGV